MIDDLSGIQMTPTVQYVALPTVKETEVNVAIAPLIAKGAVSFMYFGQYTQNYPAANP